MDWGNGKVEGASVPSKEEHHVFDDHPCNLFDRIGASASSILA